ncbi:hypothetical protein ACIBSV_11265 [Embleya sp. NPDC050154]|uniref:hypothetical protein n=1 Tax=Embleya sp. NPDC050154 TaxID=3363988 RepID=UPI0037B6D202
MGGERRVGRRCRAAEPVDLRLFPDATPKCSILEVAQAIGRALRQHPGEGRTATAKTPTDGANAGSD